MGHFDETICDCCVCPMQCVLEQLVGEEVTIFTGAGTINNVVLDNVKNFIVSFSNRNIAISQIFVIDLAPELIPGIRLKPIKNNTGECACLEDPMTNLLDSMKGQVATISSSLNNNSVTRGGFIITNVGSGIVIVATTPFPTTIFSTCSIVEASPG